MNAQPKRQEAIPSPSATLQAKRHRGGKSKARPSAISEPFSRIADYISLTKPGVMVLLLISTACPMILASAGSVSFSTILYALVGGGLVSGSAAVINCIWDRDIDAIMTRTRNRPIATGRVSPLGALVYSVLLAGAGLWILGSFLNWYAAAIALFGHLFYVLVYTMWLKRTTPQNIVIGGAAGAVPPLVGWVAVTGDLNLTAICLFALVFLWTPPHFWALALNKNEDYRRANVPMLPVVAGELTTVRQMFIYALTLIPTAVVLVISDPQLGAFSLSVMTILGVVFCWKIYRLRQSLSDASAIKTKAAWSVFSFSLLYLALFFACLVVDSTII